MGVYDRDYYRNDPPGGGVLGGVAPVCKGLIVVNVIVFVLQILTRDSRSGGLSEWLALSPGYVLQQWEIWRLLTYAFCHDPDSLLHLVFNMLFLWMMGSQIEHIYGSREFLKFYLTAAV